MESTKSPARRKARRRAALQEEEHNAHSRPGQDLQDAHKGLDQYYPSESLSYQPLSIPPVGSFANKGVVQPRPSFDPTAYRNSSRDQPLHKHNDSPQPIRYQPGQGFVPIKGPCTIIEPPEAESPRAANPHPTALSGVGVTRNKHAKRAPIEGSTLSVVTYHRLPPFRINKHYRHTSAHYSHSPVDYRLLEKSPQRPVPNVLPHRQKYSTIDHTSPPFRPTITKTPLIHLPAPTPTPLYLSLAQKPPTLLLNPSRLLLILDLNGTLLARTTHIAFTPRPHLSSFLTYAFANHSILIWSSAQPKNVHAICEKLFTQAERHRLLGEWGRDTLELTPEQYAQRVQVYKRLNRVWMDEALQRSHPGFNKGERWSQNNTLLIDDSVLKASAQPFNHVEVPEFVNSGGGGEAKAGKESVLAQVLEYLEEARRWSDVSAFVRKRRFAVKKKAGREEQQQRPCEEVVVDDEDDEEDGGVRL